MKLYLPIYLSISRSFVIYLIEQLAHYGINYT